MIGVEVRRTTGADPVAREPVAAMMTEIGEVYAPGMPAGPSATPEELSPPHGGFVLLYDGDRAVAGGGVKRIDDRTCEIKRMYVVPAARGRGLGAALLAVPDDNRQPVCVVLGREAASAPVAQS